MTFSTRLEEIWGTEHDLVADTSEPAFNLICPSHPGRVYAGKTYEGELLFLVLLPGKPFSSADYHSVSVQVSQKKDSVWSVLFKLQARVQPDIFYMFCNDILQATEFAKDDTHFQQIFTQRVDNWTLFFTRNDGLLSESEQRGLFAELWVLLTLFIPLLGVSEAVRIWVGGLGAHQDFQDLLLALEVKSVHLDTKEVKISSEHQLDPTVKGIYLSVVYLGSTTPLNGFSLDQMVDQILVHCATEDSRRLFLTRLNTVGYRKSNSYSSLFFKVLASDLYLVDKEFPRLQPSYFSRSIKKVSYSIELSSIERFKVGELRWS